MYSSVWVFKVDGGRLSVHERFMSLVRDAFISAEDLDQKDLILRASLPYCYCQTLAVWDSLVYLERDRELEESDQRWLSFKVASSLSISVGFTVDHDL